MVPTTLGHVVQSDYLGQREAPADHRTEIWDGVALDPDDSGRVVWSTRVGAGGVLGGVQWGASRQMANACTPRCRISHSRLWYWGSLWCPIPQGGGLHALRADTGAIEWSAPPAKACADRTNCSPAQSGAVTATPDFVLSGAVDGHVRAYSTTNGAVLWDYDTAKPFTTVNEVKANGGALDSGGPTIAGGMLFVSSGYGLYGGQAGNVLLAFKPRP